MRDQKGTMMTGLDLVDLFSEHEDSADSSLRRIDCVWRWDVGPVQGACFDAMADGIA